MDILTRGSELPPLLNKFLSAMTGSLALNRPVWTPTSECRPRVDGVEGTLKTQTTLHVEAHVARHVALAALGLAKQNHFFSTF